MNSRAIIFISLFSVACTACFVSGAAAQPGGFAAVTPEKIAELETMHQQAIDSLIKNDFQSAIRAYSDILLMEPDDETAYTGLGQIYTILGHYKKAHEAFQNALQINPDNEVALSGIQKIMDPDGAEGMTNPRQIEVEAALADIPPTSSRVELPEPFDLAPAPGAPMDKRALAVKLKKGTPTSKPRPAVVAKPVVARPYIQTRRVAALKPGLLHAQRAQMALRNSGYYRGPVNGLLGGTFKRSLREFQQVFGIEPTGNITQNTWSKLSEYLTAF